MMKKIVYRLTALGCLLLSLSSFAADPMANASCGTGECDDVVFTAVPDFRKVACHLSTPTARKMVFTLQNNEANIITLYDIQVTNQQGVPDTSGVKIALDTTASTTGIPNCIPSGGVVNNIGTGSIPGSTPSSLGQCTITLNVTPPTCTAPIQTPIARELFIGVQSQQAYLIYNIDSAVSVIGSGEEFAILGNSVVGTGQVSGDLGYRGTAAPAGFSVSNGAKRSETDQYTINAQTDFLAAYTVLTSQIKGSGTTVTPTGCNPRASIDAGDVIYPGSYCLQPTKVSTYVTVGDQTGHPGEPITLVGDGPNANFYFFVDSNPNVTACLSGTGTPVTTSQYRCDLKILPDTEFVYENGASPANVFWIMGNQTYTTQSGYTVPTNYAGIVYLGSNAKFDGVVLQGAGALNNNLPKTPIQSSGNGSAPTAITGNLWVSNAATNASPAVAVAINLINNAVTTPANVALLESLEQ